MSDKPEKIYAYPGSLIYSLKPAGLTVEYLRADLAKPSEEVKRLEDRIVEVESENFNLMVDSFDFVPTNTHLKLVKKCKELEQAKPSECDCCRKPSEEYYSVCPECFKNDHQQEAKPSEGCESDMHELCNEDQRKVCGQ